jgi:hypothetical protein
MVKFGVPTAYLDGRVVADLAADEIRATKLTNEQLLACVANVDQVAPMVHAQLVPYVSGKDAEVGCTPFVVTPLQLLL